MSLFSELKRRNVIRVAGFYLVAAWLVTQVAATLLPVFEAPGWVMKVLVGLLALGFLPALAFAWVFELTPEGLKRETEIDRSQSTVDGTARKLDIAVIVMLLTVGGLVLWQQQRAPTAPDPIAVSPAKAPASVAPASASATAIASESIAVLAFADMSPGKDNEFLGDGIAEEILNALAKLPGLKVAGRTSSFHFKGRNEDLRDIGQALGVAHVLEGSVRRQGDQVRITAQLIRTADGFHLWSETYPGTIDDVFELQERIARAIVSELKVVLQGDQAAQLVRAGTSNPEAYARYLQASAIFHRRQGPRFEEAEKLLHEAITLDPNYARAWARLASIRAISNNYRTIPSAQFLAAVQEAADKAIAIDANLGESYAARGLALGQQRRLKEERQAFERALTLDPEDLIANVWYGIGLIRNGYRNQGAQVLDRTLELDPMLPIALLWRGSEYVADGDFDNAERMYKLADESGLAFIGIGHSALAQARGDNARAAELLAPGLKSFSVDFPAGTEREFAAACHGNAAARIAALARVEAYLATQPKPVAGMAPYVLFCTGEFERAFEVAGAAPTSNDALVFGALFRGIFPGALQAPGFAQFARDVGWAEHWDEFGPPDLCRKSGDDYVCK